MYSSNQAFIASSAVAKFHAIFCPYVPIFHSGGGCGGRSGSFKKSKSYYFGVRNVSASHLKVNAEQNLIRSTNSYHHTWTGFGPSITKDNSFK